MAEATKNYRQYKQKAFGPWILDIKNPTEGLSGPEQWKLYSETDNKHQNTISLSESGHFQLKNDGAVTIRAGDRNTPNSFDIKIDAARGQISITAATTVKIKGKSVMVEALEDLDLVAGQNLNIKAGGRLYLEGNVIDKNQISGSILPPNQLWTNRILARAPVGGSTLFKIGLGLLTGGLTGGIGAAVGGLLGGGVGGSLLGGLGGDLLGGALTGDLFGGALGGLLGEGLSGVLGEGLGGIVGDLAGSAFGGGDIFGTIAGVALGTEPGGGGLFGNLLTGAIDGLASGDIFGGLVKGGLDGLGLTDGSFIGDLLGGSFEGVGLGQILGGIGVEAASTLLGTDAFSGVINGLATGQGFTVADIGGSVAQIAFGENGIFGGDSAGLFTNAVSEIGSSIFDSINLSDPSNLPADSGITA